jgi:hypothetical protein
MDKTTWRIELNEALEDNKETWEDIVSNTMTNEQMDKEFDPGWGVPEGCEFTVWTNNFVYFPLCYDGSESVGCVSRNPDDKPTNHLGGW